MTLIVTLCLAVRNHRETRGCVLAESVSGETSAAADIRLSLAVRNHLYTSVQGSDVQKSDIASETCVILLVYAVGNRNVTDSAVGAQNVPWSAKLTTCRVGQKTVAD